MSAPGESASARLSRLLTMVPWLVNRQGIALDEAAADLGVSVAQLESDLQLLFLCGYGQMPDELIDAAWDGGRIFVRNAQEIARPLRLAVDEAITLIVGLRTLLEVPGLTDRDAIVGALRKLEQAAGTAAEPATRVHVDLSDDAVAPEVLAGARRGVQDSRRLHLRYHVPGRDESTERDVDPITVVAAEGRWYLEGWCHRAEAVRMFRLDRVEELTVLETTASAVAPSDRRQIEDSVFAPGVDDVLVSIRLHPGAHWVGDYYPTESNTPGDDGTRVVTMRVADTAWLERLALQASGAEVLAPPTLRKRIATRATATLTAYRSGS